MAVEDDEPRDRQMWSNVARVWYDKAADMSPNVGRLYHHLAILAHPYTLEQMSLFTRALTCLTPFESARGSLLTLFNPILHTKDGASRRPSSFETVFIKAHGILFTSQPSDSLEQFDKTVEELDIGGLYQSYISEASFRFKETGVHAAVSNIAALMEHGSPKQKLPKPWLRFAYENAHRVEEQLSKPANSDFGAPGNKPSSAESSQHEADISMTSESDISPVFMLRPSRLAFITLGISLEHATDSNVYPLVHVYLVVIWSLGLVRQAWNKFEDDPIWRIIERDIPWASICSFHNTLAAEPQAMTAKVWAEDFPQPEKEPGRPLPEDFIMRGQLYSRWYFPRTWFTDTIIDAGERTLDPPSMSQPRVERMLWLGLRIASVSLNAMLWKITNTLQAARRIHYDIGIKRFVATDYVSTNLIADPSVRHPSIDQGSIMSDVARSESDFNSTQYTPSECSTMSDVAPCFTPKTASGASSESYDDSSAPTTGGSERKQKQIHTADFISHYESVCSRLQCL